MEAENLKNLAKKIYEIQSENIIKKLFEMTGWDLDVADFKAGVYEIDIWNALDTLSDYQVKEIEAEINKYYLYSVVFVKYGYSKVYAKNRTDAIIYADKMEQNQINWRNDGHMLRIISSKNMHEIRIANNNSTRVFHTYAIAGQPMRKEEVKDFIAENVLNVRGICRVWYSFIQNSTIKKEENYVLEF